MAWTQYPSAEKRGDENGNVEEIIGDVWTPVITGGGAHVTSGSTGQLETRIARFNAAADLPADPTSNANVLADLVTYTFTGGAKRCRITYHDAWSIVGGGFNGPVTSGAFATINAGTDVTAAARLTLTDVTGGNTSGEGVDTKKRLASKDAPTIEWDLTGTDSTIDDVYLVGVYSGYTPSGSILPTYATVEVW